MLDMYSLLFVLDLWHHRQVVRIYECLANGNSKVDNSKY